MIRLYLNNFFPFALASTLLLACDTRDSPQSSDGSPNGQGHALPVLGQVPDFTLTNQNGQAFGAADLKGKPYVAAFMFTRCPSICPRLTKTMKTVDDALVKAGLVARLLSISVDPDYDTPQTLSDYAKKHGADPNRWTFLTGDFKNIATTAEQGFKVGLSGKLDPSKPHMGITHASHLIVVDGSGQIRGYFRTSDEGVTDQIVTAMTSLQSE